MFSAQLSVLPSQATRKGNSQFCTNWKCWQEGRISISTSIHHSPPVGILTIETLRQGCVCQWAENSAWPFTTGLAEHKPSYCWSSSSFRSRKECHLLKSNTKRKTKPEKQTTTKKKTLDDTKFGTRVSNIFWLVQITPPSLWMLKKNNTPKESKEVQEKTIQIPFCLSGVLRRVFPFAQKRCLRWKPGQLSQNTPDLCGRST